MPPRLRRRVDALRAVTVPVTWAGTNPAPAVDPDVLITVAQACRDDERLEFGYTARDRDPAERLVEPHRLVPLGRRWYLVAYDLQRHDWRSFRLDRLTGPRRTGARFLPRTLPTSDAAEFVRAGIRNVTSTHDVEALVRAPAEAVRAQVGRWATIEEVDERSCLLRMQADDLDWPVFALGGVGAEFEVRSPPELVDRIREWGDRFGRATAGRAR
jgi:predicted DNA-binding transcriptional regulator YafY